MIRQEERARTAAISPHLGCSHANMAYPKLMPTRGLGSQKNTQRAQQAQTAKKLSACTTAQEQQRRNQSAQGPRSRSSGMTCGAMSVMPIRARRVTMRKSHRYSSDTRIRIQIRTAMMILMMTTRQDCQGYSLGKGHSKRELGTHCQPAIQLMSNRDVFNAPRCNVLAAVP